MNEVTEQADQPSYFLGSVCTADETSKQWTVQVHVDSTPVEFKIHTGADVNIINEDTFHTLEPLTSHWTAQEVSCCVLACLRLLLSHRAKVYVVRGCTVNQPVPVREDEPCEASR